MSAKKASTLRLGDYSGEDSDTSRPKKRNRIAQACKSCGTKKQKCDGQQPCRSCINAKIADSCEYGVAKKRGPPKGYTRQKKKDDEVEHSGVATISRQPPSSNVPPIIPVEQQIVTSAAPPIAGSSKDAYMVIPSTSRHASPTLPNDFGSSLSRHSNTPAYPMQMQQQQQPAAANANMNPILPENFTRHFPSLYQPQQQPIGMSLPSSYNATPHMVMPSGSNDVPGYPESSSRGFASMPVQANMNYSINSSGQQVLPTQRSSSMDMNASQTLLALQSSDIRSSGSSPRTSFSQQGQVANNQNKNRQPTEPTRLVPHPSGKLTENWETADVAMSRIDEGYRGSTSGLPAFTVGEYGDRLRADKLRAGQSAAMQAALTRSGTAAAALNLNPPPKTSLSAILHDYERSVDRSFLSHALKDVSPTGSGPTPEPGELPFDEDVPLVVVERLISVFLTFAHSLWPVVYGRGRTSEAFSSDPVLFNAACAIAARTLEGVPEESPGVDTNRYSGRALGSLYFNRARFHLVQSNNESSVPVLQGLIFMALREMGTGRSAQGWQYSGIASRMALDLGLHRHPDVNTAAGFSFSPIETEERIRCFWGVYILDKLCSAVLGRPVLLRQEDLDCPLPTVKDANDLSEYGMWDPSYLKMPPGVPTPAATQLYGVSAFRAFASLACILENIITGVYSVQRRRKWREDLNHSTLQEISAQLEDWRAELPAHLAWGPHVTRMGSHLLVMNAVFFLCHLLLHRTYIPVAPVLTYKGIPMPSSHQICTNAADSICKIAENYHRNFGFRKVSTQMVYVIFTAAAMQVANRASADRQLASKAQRSLQQCMGWLEELSGSWTLAAHHRQILVELDEVGQNELTASRVPQSTIHSRTGSPVPNQLQYPQLVMPLTPQITMLQQQPTTHETPASEANNLWGAPTATEHSDADLLFWNEMPISMDYNAWTAFTNNYSSQLTELEQTLTDGSFLPHNTQAALPQRA